MNSRLVNVRTVMCDGGACWTGGPLGFIPEIQCVYCT